MCVDAYNKCCCGRWWWWLESPEIEAICQADGCNPVQVEMCWDGGVECYTGYNEATLASIILPGSWPPPSVGVGVLHLLACPRLLAVGAVTTIHGPHEPGQQQRSGYNGTSDITASAPPPASWPRPGLGLRIQSPHDRSPRGQLHGSSLGASVPCPPAEPVLCFQTNSCDDAGSGPPQLHPRGGRPGAGVGRSV